MSQAAVDHYLNEYQGYAAGLPGWLDSVRRSAIDSFSASGFPTPRHEDWKYTDVRPITKRLFRIGAAPEDGIDPALVDGYRFQQMDCLDLVFIDGVYSQALSRFGTLPDGVVLQPLREALASNRDDIEVHLRRVSRNNDNGFAALNSALLSNGVFIKVPDGVAIEQPLNLMFLSGRRPGAASHLRNLILAGRNASLTVIENYIGVGDSEYMNNTHTDVIAAAGAQLDHYKLQQESLQGYHVGRLRIHQHRDSQVASHNISLGGAMVRNDIETDLAEPGAGIILNGLYIANGRQHVDNHTWVHHLSPLTRSQEYYRGVLDGHARGVFNGKVVVHKQAQKTDAHQSNANLLLSDNAEIDTKPELEIYADDVKCSHGATIGQLDENMLFYLRTRAIDRQTARSLLTFAFADEVISRIGFAPVRDRLESIVVGKLPDSGLIREFMK